MARPPYALGLGLTEEHRALASAVADLADRVVSPEVVRASLEQTTDRVPPFWGDLVAYDLLGLQGADGGGLATLAVALEALGRRAAPGPFVPTVLASALLAADGGKACVALQPGLTDGTLTAAVALASCGVPEAREVDGGVTVSGVWQGVLGTPQADVLLVPVPRNGSPVLVAIAGEALDSPAVQVVAQDGIDVTRGAVRVTVTDLTVGADGVLAELAPDRAASIATVVLGAEAVGVMAWCVETAAQYAKIRVQFGRPIGQFQGVKHLCARMGIALEQARAVVWDAAVALDRGGIGFTWEHDAHLYYRRALALRGLLGRREDHAQRVAEQALAGRTRSLEIDLPAEAEEIRPAIAAELTRIAELSEDDQLVALGDGGWVLPHLPEPYGRGAGPLEQVVIAQEIKRAGITPPQLLMGTWAVGAVVPHGTEEQKRDLVVPTLRGEIVWCQPFGEPGAGSDLASLQTKAVKVDGGWTVTGQKIWTSVAQFAEWAMLVARTDPGAAKHERITYFVLDMSTPGITVRPLREMTGSALFNEVFLDEVFIPDAHVVGEVNRGWEVARTTLAGERVALSQKMDAYANDKDLLRFARSHDIGSVARSHLGALLAESRAIDVLGARIVLQQLAGIDVSTASSVGKLLAMGISQKIAEYVVAELGIAGVVSVPGAQRPRHGATVGRSRDWPVARPPSTAVRPRCSST